MRDRDETYVMFLPDDEEDWDLLNNEYQVYVAPDDVIDPRDEV